MQVARRLPRASSPVSASSISDREQDVPEIGLPGAGSSSLSYDSSLDQYVYVWKTNENWAGTCRRLVVRLIDGTDHVAEFRFK